jgi:hypothetical protein
VAPIAAVVRRILALDDNVDAADLLAEALAVMGHDARACSEQLVAVIDAPSDVQWKRVRPRWMAG